MQHQAAADDAACDSMDRICAWDTAVPLCWISRLHDFQSKKFAAALKWKLMLKHNITAPVDLLHIQNYSNWMARMCPSTERARHPRSQGPCNPIWFPSVPWSKVTIIGDGHPTFNRNPYNGYINPYYWVDDHPLLYGNNGSLDPGTSHG